MSAIQYLPLSRCDPKTLLPLLEEEEEAWMAELGWDYAAVRRILVDFVTYGILPGMVAFIDHRAVAYSYFMINQGKGTIGSVFASSSARCLQVVEEIIDHTVSRMKNSPGIYRIEAQIMPFNNVSFTDAFVRQSFFHLPRYYMELDLDYKRNMKPVSFPATIARWNSADLPRAAAMLSLSYQNQIDALLFQDYSTREGCENYLNGLLTNPSCGVFMPEASFTAVDSDGALCGLVFCCRISRQTGLIPQIAVSPSYQGQGLGNALIGRVFESLETSGIRTVSLTATAANRRALEWYRRLGFKIRKEFAAYVWQRPKSDTSGAKNIL